MQELPEKEVSMIEQIANKVGIAFQIEDDILDVVSTSEEIGKPAGSDEKNGKIHTSYSKV